MPRGHRARGPKNRQQPLAKEGESSSESPIEHGTIIHVHEEDSTIKVARRSQGYLEILSVIFWHLLLDLLLALEQACTEGHPILYFTRAVKEAVTKWLDQHGLLGIVSTIFVVYLVKHAVILHHCALHHRQHLGDIIIATTFCVAVGTVSFITVADLVAWTLFCRVRSCTLCRFVFQSLS